jgi:hypothetical protein
MFPNNLTRSSNDVHNFIVISSSQTAGNYFLEQSMTILENTIHETINEYQQDKHIICYNSLMEAIDFSKKIFTKANISQPTYVDVHPDGQIALMWHISQYGIAGFFFNGQNEITYTYCFIDQEKEEKSDTISAKDFLSSDIHKVLQKSFS